MLVGAVFIEPESKVPFRDGLVLHHSHVGTSGGVSAPADNTYTVIDYINNIKIKKKEYRDITYEQ